MSLFGPFGETVFGDLLTEAAAEARGALTGDYRDLEIVRLKIEVRRLQELLRLYELVLAAPVSEALH